MSPRSASWSAVVMMALAVAQAVVVVGGVGAAEASSLATWRVPAACGGNAQLAARIIEQAGRPLTDDDPLSVDVAITTRPDGGFRAVVDLVSVRGAARRQVEGADCAAVLDAVALVLAVAMQEAPPAVAVGRSRLVAPRAQARFLVGVGLGVDRGVLPTAGAAGAATPGAAVVLVGERGGLRVELAGEIYRAGFAPSPADDQVGVEVGLLGGRARLCQRVGAVRLCGGGALGRLEGRPVGLARPSTESRRWSAILAGVGWAQRFGGRFGLALDLDGVLALDRPEFVLADDTLLHRPAAVGFRLGLGLEVEIR